MTLTQLPQWTRIALIAGVIVLAIGAGLFAYRYVTRPITLTIAADAPEVGAAPAISAIASRLSSTGSRIRLKIVETGSILESSKTFSSGQVDLAVVRADVGDLSAARSVVLVGYAVVMLIVPPGSPIKSVGDLKGVAVGVVGGAVNRRLAELLAKEYDLGRANVRFKDLSTSEARQALQSKQVNALLAAIPLTEKHLAIVKNYFQLSGKQKPDVIPIETVGAITNFPPPYESYDLPKGTLRGSPPIPVEDMTTLRVPLYLVVNNKVDDVVVTELTQAIFEIRRDLFGAFPALARISAPSADKDSFIPIHPGAAAYYSGEQVSFLDKYGNHIFIGSMLLGSLTSLLAGAWRFIGFGKNEKSVNPLNPLYALATRIHAADSDADLTAIEEEIDNILKAELEKLLRGDANATNSAALSLATHRLEHLIGFRRSAIEVRRPSAKSAS